MKTRASPGMQRMEFAYSRIDADTVLAAYRVGIFPMGVAKNVPYYHWIEPEIRGIIPLDRLHVSRSLSKLLRRGAYSARVNHRFEDTLRLCADREDTWLNENLMGCVLDLHSMGHAHSVEVYEGSELAGGLYGISIGGAFFGESMFSLRPSASKVALVHLVDRLVHNGFSLLDTQFVSDHLATMGGIEVSRPVFKSLLLEALHLDADFCRPLPSDDGASALGRVMALSRPLPSLDNALNL